MLAGEQLTPTSRSWRLLLDRLVEKIVDNLHVDPDIGAVQVVVIPMATISISVPSDDAFTHQN